MTRVGSLTVLALLLAGAATRGAAAQGPDFSGTWVRDSVEGDFPKRAARAIDGNEAAAERESIVQTAEHLIVRRGDGSTPPLTLTLDGRETTSDSPDGPVTSRTRWQNDTIVTEGTRPLRTPFGRRLVRFTERRILLDHGRLMRVEVVLDTPRGARTRRTVFHRQPE